MKSESTADIIARCDRMVRAGLLDKAEPELRLLIEREATAKEAHKLLAVCRQLRRLGIIDDLEPFQGKRSVDRDDPDFGSEASVLISRRAAARKTVLVFTGKARQVWLSIHLLHRFLSPYDCNIVYLKDARKNAYLLGIPDFGPDQRALLRGLSDIVAELGGTDLHCLGSSAGGYMALRAGVELGAATSLAFSPATSEGEFGLELNAGGIETPDLLTLYRSASNPPRTTLVFAENHVRDARSSRRMADLNAVRLVPIPNYDGHDVIAATIASGLFPSLIDELLRGEDASASAPVAGQVLETRGA